MSGPATRASDLRSVLLAGLGLLVPAWAAAAPQVTVIPERRFSIAVELMLRDGASTVTRERRVIEATREHPGTTRVSLATDEGPLDVSLRIVPRHGGRNDEAILLLEAEVRRRDALALVTRREIRAAAGRLRLVELWHAPAGGSRLVAALVPDWSTVPRATTLAIGAEPVEIVIELRERDVVVERHRLAGLVGRPVRFEMLNRDRAAPAGRPRSILTLEVVPKNLGRGGVDLSARLFVRSTATTSEADAEPFVADVRERVGPGEALVVPLPDADDGIPRSFHVVVRF